MIAKRATLLMSLVLMLASCGGQKPASNDVTTAGETTTAPETVSAAESTTTTIAAAAAGPYAGMSYRLPAYFDEIPALKDTYKDVFLSGTAINSEFLTDTTTDYYQTVAKHYDVLVTENEMKPQYLNPSEGEFDFTAPDRYVEAGASMGMKMRGHTLVWHSQVPMWWFKGSGEGGAATSEELLARMKEYIDTVMGRYKGKIYSWDVVNECISDNGPDLRREWEGSQWAKIVGDLDGDGNDNDFIEQAFIYAREADPDAQLVLNDYSIEQDPKKLDRFYNLAKSMLEKGVPLDAVGLQAHIQVGYPNIQTFEAAIEKLATLRELNPDLKILVTELDVSIFDWNDQSKTKEMTPEFEKQLAERFADLYEMFARQAAKGNLETVVTWGFFDGSSWLDGYPVPGRTNAPLLFDRSMVAKPAFWGVTDRSLIDAAVAEKPVE
jgi:endo-1,4-beta-xylanase